MLGLTAACLSALTAQGDEYVPAGPNPVIGVDFGAGSQYDSLPTSKMALDEVAGVIPVPNWNSFDPITSAPPASGTLAVLVDSYGTEVGGATVSFSGPNIHSIGLTGTPDTPGDNRMMRGYLDGWSASTPSTITVSGLPAAFIANGYDVIVYYDGLISNTRVARYQISSGSFTKVFFGRPYASVFDGNYVQAAALSDQGLDTPQGNYVRFDGLADGGFTLLSYGTSGDITRASVQGIQIVAREEPFLNHPPQAADDDAGVAASGVPKSIAIADLLANDTDEDSDLVSFNGVSPASAAGGTVTVDGGLITYNAPQSFSGQDSFTYTISDGRGEIVTGTVTVEVKVNYIPGGSDAVMSIDFGAGTLAAAGVTTKMEPTETAGLVAVANWNSIAPAMGANGVQSTLMDSYGASVPGAAVTFSSPTTWNTGTADDPGNNRMMRGYLAAFDAATPSVITVTGLPEFYTVKGYDVIVYYQEQGASRVARFQLASGATVQAFYGIGLPAGFEGTYVQAAGNQDQGSGTPAGNYVRFSGVTGNSFTLTSYGTSGDLMRAAVQGLQIVPRSQPHANQAPVAVNDRLPDILSNTSHLFQESNLLANDTDSDGDLLTITDLPAASAKGGALVRDGQNITYTPSQSFAGEDSFTYTISDGRGLTAAGTVTINVVGGYTPAGPDPVIGIDFGAGTQYGAPFTPKMELSEVAGLVPVPNWNSVDPITSAPPASGELLALMDSYGSVVVGASMSFSCPDVHSTGTTPDTAGDNRMMRSFLDAWEPANQSTISVTGLPDAFTAKGYDVIVYYDGVGGSSSRVARYQITSGSSAWVFFGRPFGTGFNGEYVQAASTSDQGANTSQGNYVRFNGLAGGSFTLISYGTSGDILRASVQGLQIVARSEPYVSQAPVAADDSLPDVANNNTLEFQESTLLANDTDPDGDQLMVADIPAASDGGGTLVRSGTTIIYTPAESFVGQDSFTYTVSDGRGGEATAIVSINVLDAYQPTGPRPIISIDFGAGSQYGSGLTSKMGLDEVAGLFPVPNWNSIDPITFSPPASGALPILVDSYGTEINGATVSFSGPNIYSCPTIEDTPGDIRMMRGFLDGWEPANKSTITVNGLPRAFTASGYDVIVYYVGDVNGISRVARYQITSGSDTRVFFGRPFPSTFDGSFVLAAGVSDQGMDTPQGNYVRFASLSVNNFTLTSHGSSGDILRASVQGLQIVPCLKLAIARDSAGVVVTWPGSAALESADQIEGPWTRLTDAASPFRVTADGARKFYRLALP